MSGHHSRRHCMGKTIERLAVQEEYFGRTRQFALERSQILRLRFALRNSAEDDRTPSVFFHRGIDLVCPRVNAAFEIVNVRKTSLPQHLDCLRAARATVAMNHCLSILF